MRTGLHTGECELVDGKVAGIAVHTGARVASEAAPDEVLVSSTVKDLVAGSGIEFEERGVHSLKGVPGEWQLFAGHPRGHDRREADRRRLGASFLVPATEVSLGPNGLSSTAATITDAISSATPLLERRDHVRVRVVSMRSVARWLRRSPTQAQRRCPARPPAG